MKVNNIVFWGVWIIIGLLIIFNVRIQNMGDRFDRYCVEQYDINGSCPCMKQGLQNSLLTLNISNLEPVYTQNQSSS